MRRPDSLHDLYESQDELRQKTRLLKLKSMRNKALAADDAPRSEQQELFPDDTHRTVEDQIAVLERKIKRLEDTINPKSGAFHNAQIRPMLRDLRWEIAGLKGNTPDRARELDDL